MRYKKVDSNLSELAEMVEYDPITGNFRWKKSGSIAGCRKNHGYIIIKYKGVTHRAHRLAFFILNGYLPDLDIDHKNGIRHDNRAENIRLATFSENQHNAVKPQKNNTSGYRGVSFYRGKFRAEIYVKRKKISLGYYDTAELAHFAYIEAKKKFHPFCAFV